MTDSDEERENAASSQHASIRVLKSTSSVRHHDASAKQSWELKAPWLWSRGGTVEPITQEAEHQR